MDIAILSASTLPDLKRRWELEDLCGHQLAKIGRLEARIHHLEEQRGATRATCRSRASRDGLGGLEPEAVRAECAHTAADGKTYQVDRG